ncbi:hypothetical protein FJ970_17995 [Mesorhizobium sp. B2-1-8]|uniref:hypothetical protein n=1 Tax=Mesorhizobium sp. B2-1-8 TaxID=2589967 RepID=UPI0011268CE8|nr:hypothetical protein [Mesorhizobium sp. B2-1-8]UCI17025.1 hypothetical protein FJ970_17995 [Mesorhizobium sp. B2-1-8]
MLARLKAAEPDAACFRRALKLPKPGAEYLAAEKASREASANLANLVNRRETMRVEATVENPTKTIQPTEITRRTLEDLEAQIVAAQALDRDARAEFNQKRSTYHEHVRTYLAADIEGLGALINCHIGRVFELLDIASALGAEAREYRVEMPGLVSGAPAAKQFLQAAVGSTIDKMIGKGSRA